MDGVSTSPSDGARLDPDPPSVGFVDPCGFTARSDTTVPRRRAPRALAFLAVVGCLSAGAGAGSTDPYGVPMPLEVLTFREAEMVDVVGTGCIWRGGAGRRHRMSMADDRGAVKLNGSLLPLRPAPDARALFLTFDRWIGGGMRIVLHDTGRVVRRGYEYTETIARLDLVEAGRTRTFAGRLACGS